MKANFRLVGLKRYKGVGNNRDNIAEYIEKKEDAELFFYGKTGGLYYVPVFEITLDGETAVYSNDYELELIEEKKITGEHYQVLNMDSLSFFAKEYGEKIEFKNNTVELELDESCLNSDFYKYKKSDFKSVISQVARACGMRDCEVYVL